VTAKKKASPAAKISDSLGNDAYEWLVAAITTFRIPTNSQLSENKLAAQLGVSRTPVREALKRLEGEGLVRRGDAGRFTVAMLTAKEVDWTIDLLELCDGYMFERASKNLTKEDAITLKKATREMMAAAKVGDRETWSIHDTTFHEVIMHSANNEMVADVTRLARRRIQRFWAKSATGARDLVHCSDEHSEMSQAIFNQDSEAIRKSVMGHLDHLRLNMHEIVAATAPFFGSSSI
jgi:DNA-binding GntR family transcriptional regulator